MSAKGVVLSGTDPTYACSIAHWLSSAHTASGVIPQECKSGTDASEAIIYSELLSCDLRTAITVSSALSPAPSTRIVFDTVCTNEQNGTDKGIDSTFLKRLREKRRPSLTSVSLFFQNCEITCSALSDAFL